MKPALSIVIFTVLSGGGLGLAAVLTVFAESLSRQHFAVAAVLAVTLTGGGLCASVFHLANPKNAWRSLFRIRTSWLSREAACAILFFTLFMPWALLHFYEKPVPFLRAMVSVAAILTVFCTAMIYQSLKPISAWHHPQTSLAYLTFAVQSGALIIATIAAFDGVAQKPAVMAMCATVVAAVIKILYYWRIGKAQDIRVGRAMGFSRAGAKLLETGHGEKTFLTREFIFHVPANQLRVLRGGAFLFYTIAPVAGAAFAAKGSALVSVVAVLFLFAGLLAERWLFFAEARHAVRAYHGS